MPNGQALLGKDQGAAARAHVALTAWPCRDPAARGAAGLPDGGKTRYCSGMEQQMAQRGMGRLMGVQPVSMAWISRAAAAAVLLLAALALPACVEMEAGGTGANRSSAPVKLFGGVLVAMPPNGYCIDAKASRAEAESAVILMGKCSGASAVLPALITLSIGGEGSSGVLKTGAQALSDFFRSPAGRAALSRNGKAAAVTVSRVSLSGGALVMRVEDRSIGSYWRAVLGLRSRLVTISVSAPAGRALSEEGGRSILDQTIAAMRRANPGAGTAALPAGGVRPQSGSGD